MLNEKEKEHAYNRGFIPEHVTDYVGTITGGESFLLQDYLYYSVNGQLFFIGYPLQNLFEGKSMISALNAAIEDHKPEMVSLIAPTVALSENKCLKSETDQYYRLNISEFAIHQKTRNMIQRASKDLVIVKGRIITDEHVQLISEFVEFHPLGDEKKFIFDRIPEYVSKVSTAAIFSATDNNGRLVAFDIAEFGSREYAYYMFNFRSKELSVPGASDLLLNEIVITSKKQGKSFVNLGLGINKGNRFFKEKWGGEPFLDYRYCQCSLSRREGLLSMLMKF